MEVKSAFLYGKIEEEVYMCQPLGFEDLHFPNKVYKVEKALYGLHQAPRVWYETLSTNLLENEFRRGIIDKTLFIKTEKGDILLVQVYVDDIIFGSTKKSLCTEFEGLMHKNQDKYVVDILKKFDFSLVKTTSTPIETNKALLKDEEAVDVDVHLYRSMIGSLMYLIASRPDIMFTVCACARFQVTAKVSHLHAVKRIFRYLKGQPKLGLWYPRDSPFDLEAFLYSDYARASLDRKFTTRGCQFLGKRLISWQCKKQTVVANSTTKAEYVATVEQRLVLNGCLDWIETTAKNEIQKKQKSRRIQRKETDVPHTEPQTKESVPTTSNDPLPSGEDRMQLTELIKFVYQITNQVFDLKKSKTAQAKQIANLKKRVKKLERKKKSRTSGLKRLCKGRMIDNINQNVEITLVDKNQGRMNEEEMFGVNELDGDEVIAGEEVEQSTKVAKKEDELTLAQTLIEIKAAKPKAKGVIVQEPSEFRTTSSLQPSQLPQAKDKGKGIMVELEKPLKKKDQIAFDKEVIRKLKAQMKAEMEEEKRIATEKDEANMAVIKQQNEVQAKIDADMELAQKLQTKEQEQLTDAEKARLFMEFLEKRRKFFAREREIEKRNRPPTKAQQRNLMCTYLKNMDGWKLNNLKKKSFDEI
uniref:Uncharacterized mitochondrial protein AtMg00810-like n=1 Tax=Tanacetum cinerariifolium TaxID=118510 RepID=A0A6L2P6E5_TANCI|nr:uncharacterized mitochondrial protein AtMg00810-like [Tanacetum cinerariifolium]